MFIRIALIVTVIAALAAATLNFVIVREKMVTTMNQRDENAKDRDKERDLKTKYSAELKTTSNTLVTTKADLTNTKKNLEVAQATATAQTQKAADLEKRFDTVKNDRDAAQAALAAWNATGHTPDQIKGLDADLKRTREERDTFVGENKILNRKLVSVQNQLASLIGDNHPPELPTGLKGKVIAVDPRYNFVVLDIGGNQGLLERGELLVNRAGKFIGKLRVTQVQPNRAVANIIPEMTSGEVQEGDSVFY